jgi:exodeoxyribonuclease-3
VITAEFDDYFVVATYIPNAGVDGLKRLKYRVEEWDKDFQQYLHELEKEKPVIWCGDLNVAHNEIDIFNPKGKEKNAGFTPEERKSFDAFLQSGFIDTFRELHPKQVKYSYWNLRSGAR